MKLTKFKDIPKFPRSTYSVNVDVRYVMQTLEDWGKDTTPVILNPEWQRGHVWKKRQQISYLEYFFMGGKTGRDIYFNCSSWMAGFNTPIYCLDGLQRITAIQRFFDNEIPVFGTLYRDYEDSPRLIDSTFIFHVLEIESKKELLRIYYDFNAGGTPHNPKELERIKNLIAATGEDETL